MLNVWPVNIPHPSLVESALEVGIITANVACSLTVGSVAHVGGIKRFDYIRVICTDPAA